MGELPVLVAEVVGLRGVAGEVWETAGGGRTIRLFDDLQYFRDGDELAPISSRLVGVEGRPGWVVSEANQFEVMFGPLDDPEGPVVFRLGSGEEVRLVPDLPAGRAGVVEMVVDAEAGSVTYAGIFAGVDLRYTVTPTGIKEDLVVHRPGRVPVFETVVEGVELSPEPEASGLWVPVAAVGGAADRMAGDPVPGGLALGALVVHGRDGAALKATRGEVGLSVTGAGEGRSRVSVSVDEEWLRGLDRDVFPVVVDPGWYAAWAIGQAGTPAPEGMVNTSTTVYTDGIRTGNSIAGGYNSYWRTRMRFDESWYGATLSQIVSEEWGVSSAFMRLIYESGTTTDQEVCASWSSGVSAAVLTWGAMHPGQYSSPFDCGTVGGSGHHDIPITNVARELLNEEATTPWLTVYGPETPGVYTYKKYSNVAIDLTLLKKPSRPVLVSLADGSTFAGGSVTLTVNPSTPGEPGQAVNYWFRVSSSPDVDSGGIVADSGWTSATSWTIPDGILEDGGKYYWNVKALDPANGIFNNGLDPWEFEVDERLGLGDDTQPYETFGPGVVNLTNGNYVVSVDTPSVATVGGSLAAGLVFNSQDETERGLVGTYYLDKNINGVLDSFELPFQRRVERPNFNWGTGSPTPGTSGWDDNFFVHWDGRLTVPYDGTYKVGASYDDGAKIVVNGQTLLDKMAGPPASLDYGSQTVTLSAGDLVPVHFEFHEVAGGASVAFHLWCISGDCVGKYPGQPANWQTDIPTDWLLPEVRVLPDGWELGTSASAGRAWVKAKTHGNDVVITDASGSAWRFDGTNGGWKPPKGVYATLSKGDDGRFVLADQSGFTHVFATDGKIAEVKSPLDVANPAETQIVYDAQGRPSELVDPVSGRKIEFVYAGTGTCPVFPDPPQVFDDPPPSGMLCQIHYPDTTGSVTTSTNIWYSNGLVSRIWNPGYEQYDFGWTNGRLTSVMDAHVNDAIAHNVPGIPPVPDLDWEITYFGDRVDTVVGPRPSVGEDRPAGRVLYDVTGTIDHAVLQTRGLTTPGVFGSTRTVFFEPSTYRQVKVVAADGTQVERAWNPNDTARWEKDAAGRVTSFHYDHADRLTDTYGPAPQSCFNTTTWLPSGTCSNPDVARASTDYDTQLGGAATTFGGAAITYWDNRGFSGSPVSFGRDNDLYNTALPPGVAAGGKDWSARYTAKIKMPNTGSRWFQAVVSGSVRVFINDQLIIDDQGDTGARWTGYYQFPAVAGEWHDLRVEYVPRSNGDAPNVQLWWSPVGPPQSNPGSMSAPNHWDLDPLYNLATESTVHDQGAATPSLVTHTTYDEPWNGLTSTTELDPTGLDLEASFAYEPTFHRRTERTMPDGTPWTYTWYGSGEGPITSSCVGVAAEQGGMTKARYYESVANRPDYYVYDVMGRAVGHRIGASGDWACTQFDERGRTVQVDHPGGRVTFYDYAPSNNPLYAHIGETVNGTSSNLIG